jgi:uncharacterized membrane protein YvlD (DUF360 family)
MVLGIVSILVNPVVRIVAKPVSIIMAAAIMVE